MGLKRAAKFLLIFLIIFGWIFSGWPQIWENPRIPPEIKEAQAAVPSGVIIAWSGSASSIPSGWSRVTSLDGKFLKSIPNASTDPGSTGGSATHTHTTPTHSHTQTAAHSHINNGNTAGAAGTASTGAGALSNANSHIHSIPDSGSVTANTTATTTPVLGAASNEPPYQEVIWIQSDGTGNIPDKGVVFFSAATLPTNWTATSTGKFYKGAAAASDPGIDGGSATHTHTSDHSHTQSAASAHTSAASGVATADSGAQANGSGIADSVHTHSATYDNLSWTTGTSSANASTNLSLPPYIGLVVIQNNTGTADLQSGMIAIWTGTVASIPTDWKLCGSGQTCNIDIFDRFIEATSTINIGNVGGATSHSHTASGHTHISNHTHTITFGSGGAKKNNLTGATVSSGTHTHSSVTSASGGADTDSTTITVDTSTGETRPPYTEVAFIRYEPSTGTVFCSSNISSTNFGTLTDASISTASSNASTTMTCTFAAGCTLYVKDAGNGSQAGLYKSTSPTYTIVSATATLSAGIDGYGIQAATSTAGSGGTLNLNAIYNKTGNDVGGLSLTDVVLASSTVAITNREVIVTHKAAISATATAGNYSDTITYSCVGN